MPLCLEGHSDREILSLGAWGLQRLGRYSRLCLLCLEDIATVRT